MQYRSDQLALSSRRETFLEALQGLHTSVYLAGDAKATVDSLKTIIGRSDAKSVVAGGLPLPARMLVESGLRGTKHYFVEDLKPSEAVGIISRADVGVSWAVHGAARQGALMEVTFDDSVKLVSSLPRVSIFLLSSNGLLEDLAAVVCKVAETLRAEGEKKPTVSLISGPSKTADIELQLQYGVHGPHELHVILLEWI